ncbi:uncharacterized protein LOC111321985 isoform X2 [Stylophora pistillata]|uniref:uncharacterized protein LOC111321985 isoform X2 n=1 Tax=Stylophora pistillata TaxID=50429 RepID=UPI000C03D08B|nr:uncharacterized protein LOC111321985 isoform X2 [Stylophora pistillata]
MDSFGPVYTLFLSAIVLAGHCAHARNFKFTRERRSAPYKVEVTTGVQEGAGTDANVYLTVYGSNGETLEKKLSNTFENNFEKGKVDDFQLNLMDIGEIKKIKIRHDNFGFMPAWNLKGVKITAPQGQVYVFTCDCDLKQGALSKVLLPSGEGSRQGAVVGGFNGIFKDSSHCWPFNEAQGDSSPDLVGNFPAQLKDEARIVDSVARGKVASTLEQNSWIDLGNFKGRCISDPSLCANGVTMIFWARIEPAALLNNQQLPKYVLSSGGSDHRSRGFSFFHQNNQFVLRVSAAEKEWRIEIPQGQILLNSWFSFAFTWKREEGLKYYINGKEAGIKQMSESFGQIRGDEFNDFRISKPNHNNLVQEMLPMKFDQFATWNRILPPEEINQAFNQGGGLPEKEGQANPQACKPNPCQNGGTCKTDADSPQGYRCICTPQYAGVKCEIKEDQKPPTIQGTTTASSTGTASSGTSSTVRPTSSTSTVGSSGGTTRKAGTSGKPTSSSSTGGVSLTKSSAGSTRKAGTQRKPTSPFSTSGTASTGTSGGTTRKAGSTAKPTSGTSTSGTSTTGASGRTTRKAGSTAKSTSGTSSSGTSNTGATTTATPTISSATPTGTTGPSAGSGSTTGKPTSSSTSKASSGATGTPSGTAPTTDITTARPTTARPTTAPATTAPPTTASPTGTQSPPPDIEQLEKDVEKLVNVFRNLHQASDVSDTQELNQLAREWAGNLAATGEEKIDPDSEFGQLVCSHHAEGDIAKACAVKWYSAIRFFDWADPKLTVKTSPFTQLVWQSTTSIGVGIAKAKDNVKRVDVPGKYFIAVFLSPAQSDDKVKENVLPAAGISTPSPNAACPEGYFKIPMGVTRSCFTVRNTPVTWDDALLGCALDNGTLASLESREEADLIVSLIAKANLTEAWIGLHDRATEGRYVWVSGSQIPFSEWLPGEPDGEEGQSCIVQAKGEYGSGWADRQCSDRKAFVCEVPAPGHTFYKFTFNLTEPQSQSSQYPSYSQYSQSYYPGSYYPTTCAPVVQNVNDILRDTIARYFQAKNLSVQPIVNTIRCLPDGKSIVEVILRLGPEASPDAIDSLKTSIHENDGELELQNGASAKLINVTVLLPGASLCPNQCMSSTCQPGCDPTCCAQAPAPAAAAAVGVAAGAAAVPYPSPASYQPEPVYPQNNPWQCPIACTNNVNYCPPYCSPRCCNKRRSRVRIHKF